MINDIKNEHQIKEKKKKLTKNNIRSVFIRSNLFQGSWNFERMQALGFCFSMIPIIRRLYKGNSQEQKQAIKRHLEFFNTHPYVAAPILGVTLAMEEKKANSINIKEEIFSNNDDNQNDSNRNDSRSIDDASINGLKVGLMGPLAGVGDPIFWGTARPVLAALGSGMAIAGSLLGPVLFFISFNTIRLTIRYYGIMYGYKKGINIVDDIKGGILNKLTEGSSILGLFVIGALVNKWTNVNIPCILTQITDNNGHTTITTVQDILDQLMPGIVPLLLTFTCMWLLNKRVNALWIIVGFFGIGILGNYFGFLG